MSPSYYMRICFSMMDSADVGAFLPDYTQSRGARLESDWCQYVGKQTMYLWDGSHTLEGAAMAVPCSRRTAAQWHGEFVRLVASNFGLLDE